MTREEFSKTKWSPLTTVKVYSRVSDTVQTGLVIALNFDQDLILVRFEEDEDWCRCENCEIVDDE